ncbi:hypothetical protein PMAYCL1PPCAC_19224, partial [Pristionchus mayeri]
ESLKPSTATPAVVNTTVSHPITSTTQSTTKSTSASTTTGSSQCSCAPGSMQFNQGTPSINLTFASVNVTKSEDGCDLTVHCEGRSPLSIGVYYSSTVQGDSPILNMDNSV